MDLDGREEGEKETKHVSAQHEEALQSLHPAALLLLRRARRASREDVHGLSDPTRKSACSHMCTYVHMHISMCVCVCVCVCVSVGPNT